MAVTFGHRVVPQHLQGERQKMSESRVLPDQQTQVLDGQSADRPTPRISAELWLKGCPTTVRIARDWNVKQHDGAGFVTRFEFEADYSSRYPIQQAGVQAG